MKLNAAERLKLLELLPPKESYSGVKEIHRMGMLLSLTGEEFEELEVVNIDGGGIKWNTEKALGLIADIPMGEWMTNIFRVALREKSLDHDLDPAEITLYEKFIMDYE